MEANQNPPSQENLHLHNEETEDKKKNQEEEEEVMMDQCLLEFVGDAVLFPLAYPYRPPVDVVVVVDLLNHPADLEKWRDYYSPSHLEKWKHGRVLYEFVHEGVIYMFVIRESPADLEKRKLMHWIRHTESISCLEQLDIGWVNMSARYYYKEIAELYEQEQSLEQTIVYYERAADLFQRIDPVMACCGAGGSPYNYDFDAVCGDPPSTACAQPSLYISWDGAHFTEAVNRLITKGLLEGPYTTPHLNSQCSQITKEFGYASAITSRK